MFIRTIISVLLCLGSLPAFGSETKIVFLGDSLTEGFGVASSEAYPILLNARLKKMGKSSEVINASVSGSTSASAVSRVRWVLKGKPNWIVLALGSNDMLRGISPVETERNLADAIVIATKGGTNVILVGMKAAPNLGPEYVKKFDAIFPRLAKKHTLPFVPFLLDGVAGVKEMNIEDGIHPNTKGHEKMADNVMAVLEKLL